MRFLLLAVVLLMLACTRSNSQATHENGDPMCSTQNLLLTGDSVGPIGIGQPVEAVHRACRVNSDATELGAEALPVRVLRVQASGDTLEVEIDADRVWRIALDGPSIRTREGIGVGSSLSDLLRAGEPQATVGDGALFVQIQQLCGLSFQLAHDLNETQLGREWTAETLRQLPSGTSVDRVLVVGCSP
jgi:hypothetical protein